MDKPTCAWCGSYLSPRKKDFCSDKCKDKMAKWPGGRSQMLRDKAEARKRHVEFREQIMAKKGE